MIYIREVEDGIGDKDLSGHRIWNLDNGNKIHFKKHDPYGHWTINYDKGPLPPRLEGMYTDFYEATKAAAAYLNTIERKVVDKTGDSAVQPAVNTDKKGKKWQSPTPSP